MDEYEEEQARESKKSTLENAFEYWYLWMPLVAMLVLSGRLGVIGPFDKAQFFGWTIVLIGVTGKFLWEGFFHRSPKLVWNDGFDTTAGFYRTKGNYAIFRRGINAWEFSHEFLGPVYICPIDAVHPVGQSFALTVDMKRVTIDMIPPNVVDHIVEDGLIGPFYIGYASPEQMNVVVDDKEKISGLSKPKVSYLISEMEETTKLANMYKQMASGKLDSVEKFVASMSRIRGRSKDDLVEKVKGLLGKERGE